MKLYNEQIIKQSFNQILGDIIQSGFDMSIDWNKKFTEQLTILDTHKTTIEEISLLSKANQTGYIAHIISKDIIVLLGIYGYIEKIDDNTYTLYFQEAKPENKYFYDNQSNYNYTYFYKINQYGRIYYKDKISEDENAIIKIYHE